MNRDIEAFDKATEAFELAPGSIWRLPVSYSLEFPPMFISCDDDGEDCNIQEGNNEYWCEKGKYKRGMGEVKVVNTAKIRPFLILQKPNLLSELRNLRAFGWHMDSLIGVSISSFYNLERKNTNIDLTRLKKNEYSFYHYLKFDSNGSNPYEAYVVLNAVTRIHRNYFTDKIGFLTKQDYTEISDKFSRLFLRL